tara:strand:- start:184 stop:366 length:183 start_codon:yes stop_codon:yes gene_type:complete
MAKKKTTEAPKPTVPEQVPVTNEQRMEALQEQKQQMEVGYQKVMGAIELLTAIMEEEKNG